MAAVGPLPAPQPTTQVSTQVIVLVPSALADQSPITCLGPARMFL